jgi:hypothetical protein
VVGLFCHPTAALAACIGAEGIAMKLKCHCGHEAEIPRDQGRFRCSVCDVLITRAGPGKARGADDLRIWAGRRLVGLSGDAPKPKRKKRNKRSKITAKRREHRQRVFDGKRKAEREGVEARITKADRDMAARIEERRAETKRRHERLHR